MTARQTPSRVGPWANLIICGGLSWGVNVWHAMNISGGAHWRWVLALMFGTAPVVVAAIQSHHMAKGGAGAKKRLLTYAVFAMGMALSINAQASAVAPYASDYYLNWVFPVMLDLSAFMALHSLMTDGQTPSAERPSNVSQTPPVVSAGASSRASAERLPERLPSVSPGVSGASVRPSFERLPERLPERPADTPQTLAEASAQTVAERPKIPPKTRRTATTQTPKQPAKDTRERARELLKANPDMNAADLARALDRKPSGYVRTLRTEVLTELADAGEIERLRAVSQ